MPTAEESLFELSANPRFVIEVPNFGTFTYIMKYFPHIITDTHEEHILDRAESSGLSKALLIVQVAWFCTNCVSRLNQRLPLSLLEVSTAAHAFCTLLTYFVWWSKPANVAAPTIMRGKAAREVYALLKCSSEEYKTALDMAQKPAAGEFSTQTGAYMSEKIILAENAMRHLLPNPECPPKNKNSHFRTHSQMLLSETLGRSSSDNRFYEGVAITTSPAFYGLVHFLAWSDQFPTPLERLLWRVSSFVVTCSGLAVISVLASSRPLGYLVDNHPGLLYFTLTLVVVVIPTVHMLASGFLIVESLRQLFFLDPAAYQLPSWSNYWPHLS